jgi:hypothetical protein
MNRFFRYLPLLLAAVVSACATPAPRTARVEKIGDWRVMVSGEGTSKMLCYAGASPSESEGSFDRRESAPYLMATRRNSGKIEISASSGYPYMLGSKTELAVDDDTYDLFYKGAVAWARTDEEDRDIVEAMEDADDIQLRGLSRRDLTSVDHYSSSGFAEAIERIRELCP